MNRTLRRHLVTPLLFLVLGACEPAQTAQAPDGLAPYKVAQIETLLDSRLPCLGCHIIDSRGGRIGPDLSEVGARLTHEQIDSVVRIPHVRIPTTVMPAVIMREDWRTLVIRYLAERGGSSSASLVGVDSPLLGVSPTALGGPYRPGAPDAGEPDGASLYARYCASCHGATGGGDGPNAELLPATPTRHSDAAYMSERPDDSLFDAVHAGGYIMARSHTMPPFGATLTRDEIWAVVRFMRTLCDCQGPAWSRDGAGGTGS